MNSVNKASRDDRLPSLLVAAVFLLCILPLLVGSGRMELQLLATTRENANHLHTLFEWSAFYTALCTFLLGLIHFALTRSATVLTIGAALGFAGTLDAIHVLISNGLLEFAKDRPDIIPFTWTVSRYFTALLGALSACIVLFNQYPLGYRNKYFMLLNTVAVGGLLLGFAHLQLASSHQSEPSPLAMLMAPPNDSVAVLILFLFSVILFYRLNTLDPNPLMHAMLLSMVPQLCSQLYMDFGSKTSFDSYFYVAHALKVLAYLLPFIGMALYHIRTCQQTLQALEPLQNEHTALLSRHTQLAEQNAELEAFNYIAGHDLQEPVRKLIAFCHQLRRNMSGNLSKRAEQDLHYIVDAATRMQVLIQTLLAFSKSNQSGVKNEWLSVDDCVDDVLNVLAIRINETRATIHRDPLPALQGDRCLLTLIYQNLIENALKFSQSPPVIRLTAKQTTEGWVLGVQNWGSGIRHKEVESVFAPYYRSAEHSSNAGAGVGLTICRKAIERLQGRIWVDSEPGQGCHFKFLLGTSTVLQNESPHFAASDAVG